MSGISNLYIKELLLHRKVFYLYLFLILTRTSVQYIESKLLNTPPHYHPYIFKKKMQDLFNLSRLEGKMVIYMVLYGFPHLRVMV